MLCAFHIGALLMCVLTFSPITETKEYDCPEYDVSDCNKNSNYEYRNNLECTSDYVCGIGQKCCNNCNYGYKVCTNIIIKEYLTKQDEYLKNKYCPKTKPCLTPLKYDRRYRCLSDEVCSYGYKCCKSDCYIHKVCVVPIDKEGSEAIPPRITFSTTAKEPTVPIIVITSTKAPETTKQPTEEVTVTEAFSTTSTVQTTNTPPYTHRTTTITEETSTTRETTGSVGGITNDDEDDYGEDEMGSGEIISESPSHINLTTVSQKEVSHNLTVTIPTTTISLSTAQAISTKVPISTQNPNEITASGDGVTDDNEGEDDGDDFGSGISENVKTESTVTTSVSYTKIPDNMTTIRSPVTTMHPKITETTKITGSGDGITDDDKSGDDGDDFGSGVGENVETESTIRTSASYTKDPEKEIGANTTTTRLVVTTIHPTTSPKFTETTEISGSGDGITDDDKSGDDGDDFGSGIGENGETESTITASVSYTKVPNKVIGGNKTTTKSPVTTTKITETTPKPVVEFTSSGDGITDDSEDRDDGDDSGSGDSENNEKQPTVSVSTYKYPEKEDDNVTISTPLTKTTQTPIEFTKSDDGITDDTEEGDDVDNFGSGDNGKVENQSTIIAYSSEKESDNVTRTTASISRPTPTVYLVTSTKIPDINQTPTGYSNSDDSTTDDTEGGDDGDDLGSGGGESVEKQFTVTTSPPEVSEKESDEVTTTTSKMSTVSATIHQATSTRNLETTQFSSPRDKVTDDNEDGDDGDDFGSGTGESKSTRITYPTSKFVSKNETDLAVNTTSSSFIINQNPLNATELTGSGHTGGANQNGNTADNSIGSEKSITLFTLLNTTSQPVFAETNTQNATYNTESANTSSQGPSIVLTTVNDFGFEDKQNITVTAATIQGNLINFSTNEYGTENETVNSTRKPSVKDENDSFVTIENTSIVGIKSTPLPTPIPVEFDYEEVTTTNTSDSDLSNVDNLESDKSSSSSTQNKTHTHNDSSGEKSTDPKESLRSTQEKKRLHFINSNNFSKQNLSSLLEGSADNGEEDSDNDDDNDDDVDEDIRWNFNHSV